MQTQKAVPVARHIEAPSLTLFLFLTRTRMGIDMAHMNPFAIDSELAWMPLKM